MFAGWLLSSGGGGTVGGGGTWSTGLAPSYVASSYVAPSPTWSAYVAPSYAAPAYVAPSSYYGAPLQAGPGPYGEGIYTPTDYPAMRFVGEAEQLPGRSIITSPNVSGLLLLGLGLGALLLLKK